MVCDAARANNLDDSTWPLISRALSNVREALMRDLDDSNMSPGAPAATRVGGASQCHLRL